MAKNKWFENVFLQSIFDKTGSNCDKWLTAKQTDVCTRYMDKHTCKVEAYSALDYYVHDNYTYTWGEREVVLSYSKKNGCGLIRFGMDKTEIEISNAEHEKEKDRIEYDRAMRSYTHHPDRYARHISELKNKISYWQEDMQECIQENDLDGVDNVVKEIDKLNKLLSIWLSVK